MDVAPTVASRIKLALALLLSACGASTTARSQKTALTVVLAPAVPRETETRAAIQRALSPSFEVAFRPPPSAPPAATPRAAVEEDLAAARQAYIDAELGTCLAKLGAPERVGELLAQGERLLGERLLFWRIACHVGAGRLADARREAARFAVLELEVPADVDAAAPDVEALVAETARAVAAGPRRPLKVTASATAGARLLPHAVVSVDGRRDLCVAPCTLDLLPGDHAVRLDADGFSPQSRVVRVEDAGAATAFVLQPADPALAARQWSTRHAGSPAIDGAASVSLLAAALRTPRLAVVTVEPAPRGHRLVGVLAVDGGVASRSERVAGDAAAVPGAAPPLMRDLLMRGRLLERGPPLHARPAFWIGIGLAAVAAAVVTTLLFYEPPKRTEVTM